MHSYILGTDIGTGSTKTVAVDFSGKVLCTSQCYYGIQSPKPGYDEQEPGEIFNAFIKSIKETASKMDGPPAALSLSSAMHSLMAVDERCQPLTKLILWSDARSSTIAERLKNSPEGKSIYEATGTPIHSMSPLCKIIWLRENASELFSKTAKFISIKEYIWFQLFQKFEIDYSLASATGLFDIEHLAWNKESLTLAGITEKKLSQPVPTHFIRKGLEEKIASVLQIPPSTPFCIGASDGCLANLGTNSLKSDTAAITIGTSGAVRIARTTPLRNYSTMSFNYLLDEDTFICGGPINNGGSVVQWLLKNFLSREPVKEEDYRELFEMIETVPAGCKGLLFLPYINGERAPMWDEESSGVFFGVKSYHSQAYFLRAALEGACFTLQEVLSSIEDPTQPIQQVNASGGFVQSPVWVQLLADVTGKKISILQTQDASAIGAAWLCLKALHIIPDYSSLQQETGTDIHPQKEAVEVYKKASVIFKTLYPSLKDSMHLLHNSGVE
jgi:gluconokinase